jgi:hypothetical protein
MSDGLISKREHVPCLLAEPLMGSYALIYISCNEWWHRIMNKIQQKPKFPASVPSSYIDINIE